MPINIFPCDCLIKCIAVLFSIVRLEDLLPYNAHQLQTMIAVDICVEIASMVIGFIISLLVIVKFMDSFNQSFALYI